MVRSYSWLFCLIFFLAGCGEKTEEQIIETQGDKYTVSIEKPIEVPDDFPADVYIYSRSKPTDATKTTQGHFLILTTSHEVPRVAETYKRQMMIKGWSMKASTTSGTEILFAYTKEKRVANVAIGPWEGEIRIKLTVTTE